MSGGGGWRVGRREESSLVPRVPCMRAWEGGRREEGGGGRREEGGGGRREEGGGGRRLRGEGKEGGGRREEGG